MKLWFCWHKWPLYGEKPIEQFRPDFGEYGAKYYAWFKCWKCGNHKLFKCDEHGKRLW
jgi:hypothetical protein